MIDPEIEKLLILQSRDEKLVRAETDLKIIPRERAALEKALVEERSKIEEARTALKGMELQREQLDGDVLEKEEQVRKYKRQQMEVKKNDEYAALTHEIERAEAAVSAVEEKEIELMLQIDEAKESLKAHERTSAGKVAEIEKRIAKLDEREKGLQSVSAQAKSDFETAREGISEPYLSAYDRVRETTRNFPYVAKVEDGKCSGCHLRVSGETYAEARVHGTVHFCDQCGRIVYR